MTQGSNDLQFIMNATFHQSTSLTRMLLQPHLTLNLVKILAFVRQLMISEASGSGQRFLIMTALSFRQSCTKWSFLSFFLTKKTEDTIEDLEGMMYPLKSASSRNCPSSSSSSCDIRKTRAYMASGAPFLSSIVWSYGLCLGSRCDSSFENTFVQHWYSASIISSSVFTSFSQFCFSAICCENVYPAQSQSSSPSLIRSALTQARLDFRLASIFWGHCAASTSNTLSFQLICGLTSRSQGSPSITFSRLRSVIRKFHSLLYCPTQSHSCMKCIITLALLFELSMLCSGRSCCRRQRGNLAHFV